MNLVHRALRRVARYVGGRAGFASNDVEIGRHVTFGDNVRFNCSRVRIGDGVIFGSNIVVNADVFEIGDYGHIYDYCFFPGPGSLKIGHNFWLGPGSIVDAMGGTSIGNNVGIGAHSQLWTHLKFGDVMYGCRYHSQRPLVIEDDAWLLAHCLVSPVRIGHRSIAASGSVIIRDMEPDHCYSGSPAEDVTDTFGPQFFGPAFEITSVDERVAYMESRLNRFAEQEGNAALRDRVRVVTRSEHMNGGSEGVTVLNVADRTYLKQRTRLEYRLMRFLLPDAKFVPVE